MAGYVYKDYPVPALSEVFNVTAGGSILGTWNAMGAIPVPTASPWFCVLMSQLSTCVEGRLGTDDAWQHQLSLNLGNAAGLSGYNALLAQFLHYNAGLAYLSTGGPGSGTFGETLSKARLALSVTSSWSPDPCTVTATLAAGNLRVYYWSTAGEEELPGGEAKKVDALPVLVTGGLTNRKITRFRYRGVQSLAGEMNWSVTPSGVKLYRFSKD